MHQAELAGHHEGFLPEHVSYPHPDFLVLHFHHANVVTFIVSFFAIIPLAGLLAFATDALAIRFGNTLSYP
ncbi:hypothetical protein BJV78DRAFT_1289318 [Lactifluus subvellereus]|nr:hypothetical protein BJV78DRAFT_1289318 [Lactifluus subvellereus]